MRETAARKTREDDGNECHGRPINHTAEIIFPDGPGGVALHSINACFFLCPTADSACASARNSMPITAR